MTVEYGFKSIFFLNWQLILNNSASKNPNYIIFTAAITTGQTNWKRKPQKSECTLIAPFSPRLNKILTILFRREET